MKKDDFYKLVSSDRVRNLLAEKSTPCYLHFIEIIDNQIRELRSCLDPNFSLYYAVKANPHPRVLKLMAQHDIGADVTSDGELRSAINQGITADRISFSGPGKTMDELILAVELGTGSINVESLEELYLLRDVCLRLKQSCNVGVRINPAKKPVKSGLRMAGMTQFGVPEDQVEDAIRFIRDNSIVLKFSGIHVHSGSQILDSDVIIDNIQTVLDLAIRIETSCNVQMKKVNFGGGWGIDYFPNQEVLDLESISDELEDLFDETLYAELAKRAELIIEPGRYIVGEAGIYASKVLYRKRNGDKEFAIVDGGMHHNYLLAGGMGQVIKRNFEMDIVQVGDRNGAIGGNDTVTVAGKLCSPQDILATDFECEDGLQSGDYVIFFNCGAYGLTASPSRFLSHQEPIEYFID